MVDVPKHATVDWDDLRFFLAVTRQGGLSAAAKELQVAQSTVGRRLASLETSLGVRLLIRTPDGYMSTEAGELVRARAERLEAETLSLERLVGGRDERLDGLVRVTCAETISQLVAPCLASLLALHPNITVELTPDPGRLSLSRREADVSVRLAQPGQHELVVRNIGTVSFGLYASPAYLDRYGDVDFTGGCAGHFLITQHDETQTGAQNLWLTAAAPCARVALHTDSHEAAVSAAVHGGGIACLARFRADREIGLTRLTTPTPSPTAQIWLVVHKDNRHIARVRAVLTHINQFIKTYDRKQAPAAVKDAVLTDA
jgi:DNA-binding transcriptional LysR family regulator